MGDMPGQPGISLGMTGKCGIGAQMGYKFPVSDRAAGYVDLKGYDEFDARNRPEGWNVWWTLAFSPVASKAVGQS